MHGGVSQDCAFCFLCKIEKFPRVFGNVIKLSPETTVERRAPVPALAKADSLRTYAPNDQTVEQREPVPAVAKKGLPIPSTDTLQMRAPENQFVEQRASVQESDESGHAVPSAAETRMLLQKPLLSRTRPLMK